LSETGQVLVHFLRGSGQVLVPTQCPQCPKDESSSAVSLYQRMYFLTMELHDTMMSLHRKV
jgi:hypothetical protein